LGDVELFATLSLDRNPIHFDDQFASRTLFKKRIAHGMLGAALISGALTKLMGAGNIWLSTSIGFKRPVFIGETITCTLTVREISRRGVATIEAQITNRDMEKVVTGVVESMRFVSGS
jgi:3-hydroxybutyryl-CoA dehydratase